MRLAVFDIDGTLTRHSPESDACFVRAVKTVTGCTDLDENWRDYTHVTDSAIFRAICERHLGRAPTPEEDRTVQDRYAAALEDDGVETRPIEGAGGFLRRLRAHPDWRVAFATGNWAVAAEWKLARAGLALDGAAMATANDDLDRAVILRTAMARACPSCERAVYFGDGAWDRDAARRAGVGFVAVGGLDGPHRIADYSDPGRVFAVMESACPTGRCRGRGS